MRFEWHEAKNALNLQRHGIRFETAVLVFDDPFALTLRDVLQDREERFITLGMLGGGVIAFVVHTGFEEEGEEVIRLISVRRATSRERKSYEETQQRTATRHHGAGRKKRRRY